MEDVRIKFYDADGGNGRLETFCSDENRIFISIEDDIHPSQWVYLNKATAAHLVKRLKSEISKINQDG